MCVRARFRCANALVVKQRTASKKTRKTELGSRTTISRTELGRKALFSFFFYSITLLFLGWRTDGFPLLLLRTHLHKTRLEGEREIPLGVKKKMKDNIGKLCQTLFFDFLGVSGYHSCQSATTTHDLSGMCPINTQQQKKKNAIAEKDYARVPWTGCCLALLAN